MRAGTVGEHLLKGARRVYRRALDPSEGPRVEIDKVQSRDRQPKPEDRDQDEAAPIAMSCCLERGLDRGGRVAQDVPQKEDPDAGRHRVEEALEGAGNPAEPAHGQSDEDGQPGNQPEDHNRSVAHFVELVDDKLTVS